MGIFYTVRHGTSYAGGTPVVIHCPTFTDLLSMNVGGLTIASATQDYPNIFDHTYTYFTTNQTVQDYLMNQVGFTDVIYLTSSDKYWIDENTYITTDNTDRWEIIQNGIRVAFSAAAANYADTVASFGEGSSTTQNYVNTLRVAEDTETVGVPDFTMMTEYINSISPYTWEQIWAGGHPFIPTTPDPYGPGGESEPEGGEGDFDGSSDPIDFPSMPQLSAADTGFITLFNPTATQLKALATYMWTNSLFDLATWKKIFADPMDAILGLTIVPVNVPSAGTKVITVGNIATDVSMTAAASQFVEVDCGTLNVNEYWGAYLDYDPYTKAEIYLPYIGTHALAVDDIMGKAVHVKYHVDILSGACAAYVKCGDSVLYTFIGQCASSIPITGSDMTNVINGIISAAASVGSMVATGGATAPMAVPALANTAVNGLKPSVEKSGGMSGTGGMLGIQTPYLILTRPRQCLPHMQNTFTGYPSFITRTLGNLTGYTEIEKIILDGINCTEQEMAEIESLLKSGVIL